MELGGSRSIIMDVVDLTIKAGFRAVSALLIMCGVFSGTAPHYTFYR